MLNENERLVRGVEALPVDLLEALEAFKQDTLVQEVLGEHIVKKLIEAKQEEWDNYSVQVSDWETDQYLMKF